MPAMSEEARAGAAERAGGGRRGQFKATLKREEEAARRRAALAQQQSEARSNNIAEMRRIAMESLLDEGNNDVDQEVEVEGIGEGASDDDAMVDTPGVEKRKMQRLRKLHRTLFFARQLQMPDWMCEVPADLSASWLLLVKPEGDRCLLLSEGGKVVVRKKNGYMLEKFNDARLPRGLTILDVVCMEGPAAEGEEPQLAEFDEQADVDMGRRNNGNRRGGRLGRPKGEKKYAVMDVLMWGDVDMASADAECRMFWLASRFAEMSETHSRRARPLQLIPATAATAEAVAEAARGDVGYVKDSLLFLHREGHYCISEAVTPLALMWRDRTVSRWVVDTSDKNGEIMPEKQAMVLELRPGGRLRTADHRIVAQFSEEEFSRAKELIVGKNHKGSRVLLRVEVQSVSIQAGLLVEPKAVAFVAARARVWPDSWGRIVFQHLNRQGTLAHISFEALSAAAAGISGL